eukprot:6386889-Amphidinium_carterae.1
MLFDHKREDLVSQTGFVHLLSLCVRSLSYRTVQTFLRGNTWQAKTHDQSGVRWFSRKMGQIARWSGRPGAAFM